MPRKPIPNKYYYFADITFQNGSEKRLRFVNKNLRRSAVAEYKRKYYVKKAELSEGYEE
jgi:hypothetical protein